MLNASRTVGVESTGGLKGTLRWMAPELVDIDVDLTSDESAVFGSHSKQSDVWSFGMVIYVGCTLKIVKHCLIYFFRSYVRETCLIRRSKTRSSY